MGTNNSGCGLGGTSCETCPLNTSCSSRACVGNPPSSGLPAAACTTDNGCLTGTGTSTGEPQSCILPINPADGGPSGWVGGYCNPACAAGKCPAGTCLGIFGGSYCMGNCTGPGTGRGSCRVSYVCEGITFSDGGAPAYGVCFPDCHNAGGGCIAPATCNTLGYCQ